MEIYNDTTISYDIRRHCGLVLIQLKFQVRNQIRFINYPSLKDCPFALDMITAIWRIKPLEEIDEMYYIK